MAEDVSGDISKYCIEMPCLITANHKGLFIMKNKTEVQLHATPWMNLENVMLSQKTQT